MIGIPVARASGFLFPVNLLCVWIWTALIAYQTAGPAGVLLASATPVISQAETIWWAHRDFGVWVTDYSLAVACIPATWIVSVIAAWLVVRGEEAERAAS